MCGLVGVVSNSTLLGTQLDAFKWLLHLDTVRGDDSTGVAFKRAKLTGSAGYKTTVVKTEGMPYKLYNKFPEIFTSYGNFEKENSFNFSWVMGHNRAKTIGAVNAKNAHPFHHGSIVGAHNGTISSGLHSLPASTDIVGDTDSEKIIYALSKGVPLKEIVEKLRGAIALSWYDSSDNTYHLFRNKERTLHYYINPLASVMIYASEAWMIRVAAARAKVNLVGDPIALLEDQHLSFKLGQKEIAAEKELVTRPLVSYSQTSYYNQDSQNTYGFGASKQRKHKAPAYFKANLQDDGDNIVHFDSVKPSTGWLTQADLTEGEFNHYCRYGCVACSADLDYEDHKRGEVFWLEKDAPFCQSCADKFKGAEKKVG